MNLRQPQTGGMLALMLIIISLPLFLENSFHYDIAIKVGLNAAICIGLNLLIGYTGQISLGHAGFFALGAYASTILTGRYGLPPMMALLAGALGVGSLSFIVARPILKLQGHYLAMGTLGLGIIISIVLNQEADLTGGPDGTSVTGFRVFNWEPTTEFHWYWIVAGFLLLCVWLSLNLINSPVGRALRAVHGSEIAARTMGIDTTRYKVLVFVVSAVLACIAGSLYAHYNGYITPSKANFFHSIELVTMVVLGGMASTFGAVVGAAVLTVVPQLLTVFENYEMMVFGGVLMGMMIFMRKGLVPTINEAFRKRFNVPDKS
mgnify:CR=1 FL=1